PLFVVEPFPESLADHFSGVTRSWPTVANDGPHAPYLADLAAPRKFVRSVILGPPGHLIIDHELDMVVARKLKHLAGLVKTCGHRLLEYHVDAAPGAFSSHLEVAIVFDERPGGIRLFVIKKLVIVVVERDARSQLLGFLPNISVNVGDADNLNGRIL